MARSGKIKFIRTTKDVTMEYDLIDDRIVRTDRTINGNPINLEDPNLSPEVLESIVGLGLTSNGLLNVNVSNGLTVSSSIELGGDLTRNTFIHGNTYQLSFDNLDFMVSNSNSFDIKSNFVSIDSGTGSSQYIADSDISVNSFNGSLYLGASQSYIHIDGDEMIVNSSNEKGLQYTEDLTNTFVDNSLITKKFLEYRLNSFQPKVERIVVEITGDELVNLRDDNNGYGIMVFTEIPGKITEIVNKPFLYRNTENFIETGNFLLENYLTLRHGWGGQSFDLNTVFSETSNIWIDTDLENRVFILKDNFDQDRLYKGGTGLEPNGDYPAALFLQMNFIGNPTFNTLAKAWICFDVIVRDSPNS
jgi:hypothetical protein